jgi:ribokinase
MDLVTFVDKFPDTGATVIGESFSVFPGGKGANQAIALSRLGAEVEMAGKLGNDNFGAQYHDILANEGVKTTALWTENDTSTGVAVIQVNKNGDNNIIIVPGANGLVDSDYLDGILDTISYCEFFLLQLEIPLESSTYFLQKIKERGKCAILDPAPAMNIPHQTLANIDYLTPNENELYHLTGIKPDSYNNRYQAMKILLDGGVRNVVVKSGEEGAYVLSKEGEAHAPGYIINAVDTTAAGDAFNAGLALALSEGKNTEKAITFANAVGALTCTQKGAQSAMPSYQDVEHFMAALSQ